MVFIVAFGLLFALPVSDAAPALSPPALSPPAPTPAEPCSVRIVGRDTLRVGGHPLYLEPLVLERGADGAILLAGRFVSLFQRKPEGVWGRVTQDSIFGVVISPSGAVRPVRAPIPASLIFDARASARPDGGWDVLFTELPAPAGLENSRSAIRIWHGKLGPAGWDSLQPVPLPAGHRVQVVGHSDLVRTRNGLAWAVAVEPVGRPGTVLVVRQEAGEWTYDPPPVLSAVYGALASPDSVDLLLALVAGDHTLPRDGNSLFLWARDPVWRPLGKVVASSREEVYEPVVHVSDEILLAWEGIHGDPASRGERHARVLSRPLSADRREPVTLDSSSQIVGPLRPTLENEHGRFWTVASAPDGSPKVLRWIRTAGERVSVVGEIPFPFDVPRFAALSQGRSGFVVVGGDYDPALQMMWMVRLTGRLGCSDSVGVDGPRPLHGGASPQME